MKPSPETLVDRLRGIYPSAVSQYKPSSINVEAADEIERLREEVERLREELDRLSDWYLRRLRAGTNTDEPMKPASEEDMKIYDEMAANYFKGKP